MMEFIEVVQHHDGFVRLPLAILTGVKSSLNLYRKAK
jgi:hypothetical protein